MCRMYFILKIKMQYRNDKIYILCFISQWTLALLSWINWIDRFCYFKYKCIFTQVWSQNFLVELNISIKTRVFSKIKIIGWGLGSWNEKQLKILFYSFVCNVVIFKSYCCKINYLMDKKGSGLLRIQLLTYITHHMFYLQITPLMELGPIILYKCSHGKHDINIFINNAAT